MLDGLTEIRVGSAVLGFRLPTICGFSSFHKPSRVHVVIRWRPQDLRALAAPVKFRKPPKTRIHIQCTAIHGRAR